MIDRKNIDIQEVTNNLRGSLSETLGIVVTEIGDKTVKMSMPRPSEIGGMADCAHAFLAQLTGTIAADTFSGNDQESRALDLHTNHLKRSQTKQVHATAKPIHLGKSTHVWEINICDDSNMLLSISKLTSRVVKKPQTKLT
jgi:1,4-dihydroxy-2-naphthoyl-CoA hydrolase